MRELATGAGFPHGATDAEIIEASWTDPEVFGVIFERHWESLLRYLVQRAGSDVGADLASETFRVAFMARRRFDLSYPSARPWLFGIATNLLRNQWRREAGRRRWRGMAVADVADFADQVAWRADAERLVERSGLVAAISQLRPDERETLWLFALADLSYREIALAMGVPIGTVRSRLSRLRKKLADPLRRSLPEGDS